MKAEGSGKRFNEGKIRYDLAPSYAQEQYARVLTEGAKKYGDDNWRRGMKWSTVLASMERHIAAIKKGQDYDEETGLLHAAHVMCNAAFLAEYYKIYPAGDDRHHLYLKARKIAIDVKVLEILIFRHCEIPEAKNPEEFLPPGNLMPFEPCCYIADSANNKHDIVYKGDEKCVFEPSLEKTFARKPFPVVPVHFGETIQEKLDILKKCEIDIMVTTSMSEFVAFNNGGICSYLFHCEKNKNYDVGHKRIKSLHDLV